jgi:hypothetical protein
MWWALGTVAFFIVLLSYCSCVLAGRADSKKNEWMSGEGEATLKSIPPERELRDVGGSTVYTPPEPSTFPLFGSSLVGARKKI